MTYFVHLIFHDYHCNKEFPTQHKANVGTRSFINEISDSRKEEVAILVSQTKLSDETIKAIQNELKIKEH